MFIITIKLIGIFLRQSNSNGVDNKILILYLELCLITSSLEIYIVIESHIHVEQELSKLNILLPIKK